MRWELTEILKFMRILILKGCKKNIFSNTKNDHFPISNFRGIFDACAKSQLEDTLNDIVIMFCDWMFVLHSASAIGRDPHYFECQSWQQSLNVIIPVMNYVLRPACWTFIKNKNLIYLSIKSTSWVNNHSLSVLYVVSIIIVHFACNLRFLFFTKFISDVINLLPRWDIYVYL